MTDQVGERVNPVPRIARHKAKSLSRATYSYQGKVACGRRNSVDFILLAGDLTDLAEAWDLMMGQHGAAPLDIEQVYSATVLPTNAVLFASDEAAPPGAQQEGPA